MIVVNWHTDLMGYIFSFKRLTEVRPGFPLGGRPISLTGGFQGWGGGGGNSTSPGGRAFLDELILESVRVVSSQGY